jgi:hypothetical protein
MSDNMSAREIDQALAFIDGTMSASECERWLAAQSPAERAKWRAMRQDALALQAMHAPDAPEELHEAIMAAMERSELLAGSPFQFNTPGQAIATGVVARPWALRWRTAGALAAVLVMGVSVGWALWPRSLPTSDGARAPRTAGAVVPAAYSPTHAPYAVVLEFDDVHEAEAVMRSVMGETPGAQLTCCCQGQCTQVVEGPPHLVKMDGDDAELMAIADIPSHNLVIPASELSRVLATLVGSGRGSIDVRHVNNPAWPAHSNGTVELPIFIVPSTR